MKKSLVCLLGLVCVVGACQPTLIRTWPEAKIDIKQYPKDEMKDDPRFQNCDLGEYMSFIDFSGFPKGEMICLLKRKPVYDKERFIETASFTILDDGLLQYPEARLSRPLDCPSLGYLPGERIDLRFETKRGEIIAECSFVPYPLEGIDSTGKLKAIAELCLVKPATYSVELQGLEEGDSYKMRALSAHEKIEEEMIASDQKAIHMILPEVVGEKGGIAQVLFKKETGEEVSLELPWGDQWLKILKTDIERVRHYDEEMKKSFS